MGVEKLISSLLGDAKKEVEDIVRTAEWHVEKMLSEERTKKAELMHEADKEIAKLLREQKKERIAWARLEGKRLISEAREDAIKIAIEEIFSMLKDIRQHKKYPEFLQRCLNNALEEIGGKNVIVYIAKGDKKNLSSFDGEIVEDLDAFGGLIVESSDRKVRVDMSVEAIFKLQQDAFRKKIYEELFGKCNKEKEADESKREEQKRKAKTK